MKLSHTWVDDDGSVKNCVYQGEEVRHGVWLICQQGADSWFVLGSLEAGNTVQSTFGEWEILDWKDGVSFDEFLLD